MVALAADSENIRIALGLRRSPGKPLLQQLFSPNTSLCHFICTRNKDTRHLNVNAQNKMEGLSGRNKGWKEPLCLYLTRVIASKVAQYGPSPLSAVAFHTSSESRDLQTSF